MLRAVFDHSARRFARKTTISRVGSSVQTCYQRTKTDNAGDQIPESIESHSGIHYRPPLVGFLSVEIQARGVALNAVENNKARLRQQGDEARLTRFLA